MDSPDSNKDTVSALTSPQLNSTNETEVEPSSKTNFDQSIVDMSTPVPLEEESTASDPETKECETKETETKETETKESDIKEPEGNESEVKVEQPGVEEMGNSLSQRAMDTSAPDSPAPMDNQDQAAAGDALEANNVDISSDHSANQATQPTTSNNFTQTTEIAEPAPDSVNSETDTSTDATSSTSSSSTSSSSTSTLVAGEESSLVGPSPATSGATSSTFTYEINPQYFVLPTSPHNAFFYLHYLTHVPQVYLFTPGSPFLAIAPFVIPPPVMSARVAAAPARAVNFARTNTIIQPDGRAEMQPTNASATRPDADEVIELAEAAAAGEIPEPAPEAIPSVDPIPPSGPPPNPPAPPAAAAAAAPEPNNNNNGLPPAFTAAPPAAPPAVPPAAPPPVAAAAPANPGVGAPGQNIYPRVVSQVAPPFGRHAQAAASNPGAPIIIMNPGPAQPQQNMTFVNANQQQPFLWVNAPMVAPSVPAPQPGNTGSWCYPSQSPFWAGNAHWQHTTPPPQFYVQEQGYVAQPGYVVSYPNVVQSQPPQVQHYVNGSTGPFVYYRM